MAKRIKLIPPPKGIPEGGETVMIDRDGNIYATISGLYHPPVTTGRSGAGETIDWVYSHGLEKLFNKNDIISWLRAVIADTLLTANDMNTCIDRDLWTTFILRNQGCCDVFWSVLKKHILEVQSMSEADLKTLKEENRTKYEQAIFNAVNHNFLRVRAGGKYIPEEDNRVIYFIVASMDFNWLSIISEFLQNTFRSKNRMPDIWIGTDRRGIGREILYYEGTGNFKFMGRAIIDKNSIELLKEQFEVMNDQELAVLWEQYMRLEKSGETSEQPLKTFIDIQSNMGCDLCPQLTVSSEIMREIAKRWSKERLGILRMEENNE